MLLLIVSLKLRLEVTNGATCVGAIASPGASYLLVLMFFGECWGRKKKEKG